MNMRTYTVAAAGAILSTALLTGCGEAFGAQDEEPTESAAASTGADAEGSDAGGTAAKPRDPVVVAGGQSAEPLGMLMVADHPALGPYLIDENGRTLYIFAEDSTDPPKSACADECALTWPPVPPEQEVAAHDGVDASLVDTLEREDGTVQLTFNGWPLYRYAEDRSEGEVDGLAIRGWSVVTPDGTPLPG
jgi:predicted lipoprotein with Yx(FWY)xxD motif